MPPPSPPGPGTFALSSLCRGDALVSFLALAQCLVPLKRQPMHRKPRAVLSRHRLPRMPGQHVRGKPVMGARLRHFYIGLALLYLCRLRLSFTKPWSPALAGPSEHSSEHMQRYSLAHHARRMTANARRIGFRSQSGNNSRWRRESELGRKVGCPLQGGEKCRLLRAVRRRTDCFGRRGCRIVVNPGSSWVAPSCASP